MRAPERRGAPAGQLGRGVAVSAAILMLGNVVGRILGLVREQLAAGYFGAGDAIAAFTIADNLQTLLYDLLVSGALQAALIPVLAALVLPDRMEYPELRRVGGALVTWVVLATGLLAILGFVFADEVVSALVWFSGDAAARGEETRKLTARLVRIVMPAAALLGVGTVLQAMLHALGAVTAPALATAMRNAAVIIAMLALSDTLGVESMALGTLAGAALIVLLQLATLAHHGALPVPNLDFGHPALRRMGALYLPVFLGLLINAGAVVIDRGLAWGAGELAVGSMRYATTLVQLVLGLIAAALSLASLPRLSRHFSAGDEAAFRATLGRVLGMVTVLILPATAGLALLATPVAGLIFGHGATGPEGVDTIALALLGYLPGTVAAAYDQVLMFAFYARRNTLVPVVVGVAGVGVYLVAAFGLVDRYGMMGLVVANSLQFIARALALGWLLRRRGVPLLAGDARRTLAGAVAGVVALGAAVVVTGLALVELAGIRSGYGAPVWEQVVRVGMPMAFGGMAYMLVLRAVGVRELADLRRAVATRLGRGWS